MQDGIGDIIYIIFSKNRWQKFILKSKSEKPYPKYFKMLNINGRIMLFMLLNIMIKIYCSSNSK